MIKIYNEDCFETMRNMEEKSIDIVLTSPPYNLGSHCGWRVSRMGDEGMYDLYCDSMETDDYLDFTKALFLNFDGILKDNGVVLYNMMYANSKPSDLIHVIHEVIMSTNFELGDIIMWKKPTSSNPVISSPNMLTKMWELVFVFCRHDEIKTYKCNKKRTETVDGKPMYSVIFNYIEAARKDEPCPLNCATYSSELCRKLLDIYAVGDGITVYDPFIGTGTTAVACQQMGINCIGSEISAAQCKWAEERLKNGGRHKGYDATQLSFFEGGIHEQIN